MSLEQEIPGIAFIRSNFNEAEIVRIPLLGLKPVIEFQMRIGFIDE
jgi:hypothetical protein